MDPIVLVLFVLSAAATLLAWMVARRRADYRPVAWLLTFQLFNDLIRQVLRDFVFAPWYPKLGGEPATGWLRVAAHVEQILFLSWRVAIAALAVWIYGKRRPWLVAAVFAAVGIALIVSYPTTRGPLLQKVYLGVELAVICVAIGFFFRWYFGREPWTPEHMVTGLIIALEAAMITGGPYREIIWINWGKAWAILLVLYTAIIIIEGWVWSRSSGSR